MASDLTIDSDSESDNGAEDTDSQDESQLMELADIQGICPQETEEQPLPLLKRIECYVKFNKHVGDNKEIFRCLQRILQQQMMKKKTWRHENKKNSECVKMFVDAMNEANEQVQTGER